MKKQQRKWRWAVIVFLFIAATLCPKKTEAASATVSFSSQEESVAVGEELSIEIMVETDSLIGSIEGYLDYDNSMLEYLSGAKAVSGSNGTLKLAASLSNPAESKSYKVTFRARKKGNCIIEFSEQPVIYEAETEEAMSVSYEDISIQIEKARILSNNTKLDSLQISPGTLEPSFAKTVRSYKTYVGTSVDRMTISAVPSDADATVSVQGNENLVEGENLITITVTAPSGRQKKYKLYVQKETAQAVEPVSKPKKKTQKKQKTEKDLDADFQISAKNGKIILKNRIKYTLVDLDDSGKIPAGYVKTKLILYGITVTAYTLEQDLENDFILMYAKRDGEEPQFYQYDRAEKTIQRFSGISSKSSGTKIVVGQEEKELSVDEYNNKVKKLSMVVGISVALALLFAIGMLNFAIKYFSSKAGKVDELYR